MRSIKWKRRGNSRLFKWVRVENAFQWVLRITGWGKTGVENEILLEWNR